MARKLKCIDFLNEWTLPDHNQAVAFADTPKKKMADRGKRASL